jgi:hypothetical protein
VQRFYAEMRTFGDYCRYIHFLVSRKAADAPTGGMNNISQFPRPIEELHTKATTSPPFKPNARPLSTPTLALPLIPRAPATSSSTPTSNAPLSLKSRTISTSNRTPGSHRALSSITQAPSNSHSSNPAPRRLGNVTPPPQDGWDLQTGFPKGALIFQHHQAYPHLWGKDQILLRELNSHFQFVRIRLVRTRNKEIVVVWVEAEPGSGRAGQAEKEDALNGLREYHKYDTGNLGELPWIGTFYKENRHLFHRYSASSHSQHSGRSTAPHGSSAREPTRGRTTNTFSSRDRHYRPIDDRSRSQNPSRRSRQTISRNRSPVDMKRELTLDELIYQVRKIYSFVIPVTKLTFVTYFIEQASNQGGT